MYWIIKLALLLTAKCGVEEMDHKVRALLALTEGLSSVPSTDMGPFAVTCNSSSWGPTASVLLGYLNTHTHTFANKIFLNYGR